MCNKKMLQHLVVKDLISYSMHFINDECDLFLIIRVFVVIFLCFFVVAVIADLMIFEGLSVNAIHFYSQ
ncbi:hypothetical protein C0Z01_08555 [Photobacterium kishitanii]|uniref:Uncharacterized protein n=1 Tax=Photobacterium kishitanii TaxID=318456 RepID=A0A2T3KDK2_9GAMM|nr:hypothetical protein AYY22_13925 [Photobacterium kishitanii]PSU94575.1 hypothetical protein C9J27_19685 [Photobacterium kishitanii]PSW69819.1 hypothetical protein C0Z01_08555 [Photobacterium kishitanii]